MLAVTSILVALAIDAAIGWPQWLYRLIGHPVTWIGALITRMDRWLNLEEGSFRERRMAGVLTALTVVGLAVEAAWLVTLILPDGWEGILLTGLLAWPFLAMRSLHDHVAAVARPFADGDLAGARRAVAQIVGRDPNTLDRPGVCRAALESLAENASDGIVAPVIWGAIFGLPGLVGYKAVNTLDSMIGHRSERYLAFGWASARIDDLANLIPARITGLVFALVSSRPGAAIPTMWRDAAKHRSPNAGWPEAALAGALDIRLSGPRIYGERIADEPWVNEAAPDPQPTDIRRGLGLYRKLALALILALASLI